MEIAFHSALPISIAALFPANVTRVPAMSRQMCLLGSNKLSMLG